MGSTKVQRMLPKLQSYLSTRARGPRASSKAVILAVHHREIEACFERVKGFGKNWRSLGLMYKQRVTEKSIQACALLIPSHFKTTLERGSRPKVLPGGNGISRKVASGDNFARSTYKQSFPSRT